MKAVLGLFFCGFLLLNSTNSQALAKADNLACLQKAYPILKIGADQNSVVFPNGKNFIYDDGRQIVLPRDFDSLFANPTSLLQMFLIPYSHQGFHTPHFDEDPGRIRMENFFRELYGDSPASVEKNLVQVHWRADGSTQLFQKKFGAAHALDLVSKELAVLIQEKPEMLRFVESPLGGTYEWRPIEGTHNLSTHSYGIAIDINTRDSNYWRWDEGANAPTLHYRNKIPLEIVSIFEKHGFIWGGRWYHYDTMHFEYRPELMLSPSECKK